MILLFSALLVVSALLPGIVSRAAETEEPVTHSDCRYWTGGPTGTASSTTRDLTFPQDDIFRPLVADPKQPRFFISYQHARFRDIGKTINAGFVSFGETFGLVGRRHDECNGWQLGVQGAVFAQFNLDAASHDLINADYVLGFPVTWRQGPFSARVRLYHQSSHLGDEFLLNNPGVQRVNLSFEELESIFSVDLPWIRLYGGGGYLVHREPALERGKVQWGGEIRRPDRPSPILRNVIADLRIVPLAAVNVTQFEQLAWNLNTNVMAGVEWYRPGASRRLRLLFNYYHGFNPYGQFFINQRLESFGIGFYFTL